MNITEELINLWKLAEPNESYNLLKQSIVRVFTKLVDVFFF